MMEKLKFNEAEIEVVKFSDSDIITVSTPGFENNTNPNLDFIDI